MDAAAAPAGYAQMPPPSPPPPTRPLATVDPNDMSTLTDAAARDLQIKREQLKLAMMELDLAERREKIATQQAERALAIKERELELAERERRLNPRPLPRPRPPPRRSPSPPNPTSRSLPSSASPSLPPTPSWARRSSSCPRSCPWTRATLARSRLPMSPRPPFGKRIAPRTPHPNPRASPRRPLPLPDLPPRVPMRGLARRPSPATAWATPPF